VKASNGKVTWWWMWPALFCLVFVLWLLLFACLSRCRPNACLCFCGLIAHSLAMAYSGNTLSYRGAEDLHNTISWNIKIYVSVKQKSSLASGDFVFRITMTLPALNFKFVEKLQLFGLTYFLKPMHVVVDHLTAATCRCKRLAADFTITGLVPSSISSQLIYAWNENAWSIDFYPSRKHAVAGKKQFGRPVLTPSPPLPSSVKWRPAELYWSWLHRLNTGGRSVVRPCCRLPLEVGIQPNSNRTRTLLYSVLKIS